LPPDVVFDLAPDPAGELTALP